MNKGFYDFSRPHPTSSVFPYTGSAIISGSLNIIGNQTITGSIIFDGGTSGSGASIVPNNGLPNSLDFIAGTDGWVELASNDGNQYVWVDNNGTYIVTNWNVDQKTWTFTKSGSLIVPGDINMNGFYITGSILGSSSYSSTSTSSSYALSSSYSNASISSSYALSSSYSVSSSRAVSSSFATTASIATNASYAGLVLTQNSSTNQDYSIMFAPSGTNGYIQTYTDSTSDILYNPSTNKLTVPNISASNGITGSLLGTSSWSNNALTASSAPNYVLNSSTSSMLQPYVLTSSTSSMSVATASYVLNAVSSSFASTASFVDGTIFTNNNSAASASYSQTASYAATAGNGGVTQIIAGANISVSPAGGQGAVTITSLGSSTYNTMTGSYGAFHDTGSYPIASTTTAYSASLSQTDITNGVFTSGSDKTKIYFTNAGIYNVQFSMQFENSNASQADDVQIWLRQGNGTGSASDVAFTTGLVSVPSKHGSINGHVIAGWNYFISTAANDYIQLMYQGGSTALTLVTYAAGTTPTTPVTPATILTAQRVDTFLSNTGSFSGSFTGTLIGTASWATSAISSSYPIAASGSSVYTVTPSATSTGRNNTILLGPGAGSGGTSIYSSNFVGYGAGNGAINAYQSNFVGVYAGAEAVKADDSNFIGMFAGYKAASASFSNLIGWQAGYTPDAALSIGSNNIIIGTNITLASQQKDSINLGGIIFATGSYSNIASLPSSGSQYGIGRVGINKVLPEYTLDVSGSGNFSNGLTVTGSLLATSSWANNAVTASYILNAVSSSYSSTSSYVQNAQSASYVLNAVTASYILNAVSSSYATAAGNSSTIDINLFGSDVDSYPLFSNVVGTTGVAIGGDTDLKYNAAQNKLTVGNISATTLTGSLQGTASWANNSQTASYVENAQSASYILNAVSSSRATSSSFASTASYVNTLSQNVVITGSLTVGSGSAGSNENTLILAPPPAGGTGEGGQILLSAPGGTYTSASMFDNYQNLTRLLRGTNASSDAVVAQWNMDTKQMQIPAYNSANAFTGTPVSGLAVDSNGYIITNGYTPYRYVNTTLTTVSTSAESIVASVLIPGGTFGSNDVMKMLFRCVKGTTTASVPMRIRINTSNTLAGSTIIATYTFVTTATIATMSRVYSISGTTLYGFGFTSSQITDILSISTGESTTTYNPANPIYVFFTVFPGAGDSITFEMANITN